MQLVRVRRVRFMRRPFIAANFGVGALTSRTAVPPPYVVTPPTTPSGSHPGANATAYLFFDLDSDPTESSPANAASPELVRKYTGILRHFVAGLRRSQVNESKCLGPDD